MSCAQTNCSNRSFLTVLFSAAFNYDWHTGYTLISKHCHCLLYPRRRLALCRQIPVVCTTVSSANGHYTVLAQYSNTDFDHWFLSGLDTEVSLQLRCPPTRQPRPWVSAEGGDEPLQRQVFREQHLLSCEWATTYLAGVYWLRLVSTSPQTGGWALTPPGSLCRECRLLHRPAAGFPHFRIQCSDLWGMECHASYLEAPCAK